MVIDLHRCWFRCDDARTPRDPTHRIRSWHIDTRVMRLDHVLYGTADLDVAQRRIEPSSAWRCCPAAHHVGQGSHNRIVPLGEATSS